METATYQVESKQAAIATAQQLIERSAWFAVEPRPFDWYSFSIKPGEGHEVFFQSQLHEYQNADYRSIYTKPVAISGIGECWIVLILEPTNETDASRPEDETFAGLYLVSPKLAGPEIIKECLQATTGFVYPYSPEKAAVALAEFGKRIKLVEETREDGELLLNAMRGTINRIDPKLLAESGIDKLYRRRCIQVEFDLEFFGGNYNKVGQFAYIPLDEIGTAPDAVATVFEKQTGHSRQHIVHYCPDETYDQEGKPWE